MRRPGKGLKGVNLLDLTPVRVAEWTEQEGRVVLQRPRPTGRGWRKLSSWLSYVGAAPRVRLDEVGSFSWNQIDGSKTVAELARVVRERFGSAVEPVEQRLGELIRQLREQGFVAYRGVDEE